MHITTCETHELRPFFAVLHSIADLSRVNVHLLGLGGREKARNAAAPRRGGGNMRPHDMLGGSPPDEPLPVLFEEL